MLKDAARTTGPRPDRSTRRIAMLAFPAVQMLDVMGPREVFSRTSRWLVVLAVRVETARRLLEDTSQSIETVCAQSGLGTPESMRRAFVQRLGIPPSRYRERFTRGD